MTRTAKGYAVASEDLSPALAVSQFAPGVARAECSLIFVPAPQPIAVAPVTSVMAYTMFPGQRPTAEMWARVKPVGSTCYDPTPQVRNRAFPDFDAIPKHENEFGSEEDAQNAIDELSCHAAYTMSQLRVGAGE